MKKSRVTLVALLAASAAAQLWAAPPKGKPVVDSIVETTAERVILPSGANGIVVYSSCAGCPSLSSRTSASTAYRFNEQPLSLVEFRAVLAKLPKTNINVVISGKTRELLLLDATNETAPAPVARPARNSTSK